MSLLCAFYPAELRTLMHDRDLLVGGGGEGGARPGRRVGVATQLSPLVVPDEPLQYSVFA